MSVMRRHMLMLAAAVLVFGTASLADASCVQASVAEHAARAEVVVYGTVTETRQTFAAAGGVIRFRPDRFLKGSLPGEVQVYLGPTNGGAVTSVDYEAVRRDEAHTLYLRAAGDGSWQTDACSGSHAGAPTAEETSILGAGTVASPASPADGRVVIGAIAVALTVALAAVILILRQSRGPSTFTTMSP